MLLPKFLLILSTFLMLSISFRISWRSFSSKVITLRSYRASTLLRMNDTPKESSKGKKWKGKEEEVVLAIDEIRQVRVDKVAAIRSTGK